jgi:hypothetical protein
MPLLLFRVSRRRRFFASVLATLLATGLTAEPLSKKTEIDFFREVPSRNLKGLAARSDGRLVAGPVLTELRGTTPADILWCIVPAADPTQWFVGTGPEGKIFELTVDAAKSSYTTRAWAKLDESHVFALLRLSDGAVLAGTSPRGALCLIRDGKLVARVGLPVDSIFDLLPLDGGSVLVATGNPGRIYRVDLAKFAAATVLPGKLSDDTALAAHGITLFGKIRDRNVRRLARLADGRIAAGSAPHGNLYAFPSDGGAPVILLENRDAEVTDLLAESNGDLFAALTYSAGNGEFRITPAAKKDKDDTDPVLAFQPAERFNGRSALVKLPAGGFPEILAARNHSAFYRLARHGDQLVIAGGEQGELLGYDPDERLSLTFAGSTSSQLNGLATVPGQPGRFLVLRNNAPGFSLLDFTATTPRSAETGRIDLDASSRFGAVRFNRLRNLAGHPLSLEVKTSNGSDEVEGWSPWTKLASTGDGWRADGLRGRYLKLRLTLPPDSPANLQIDKASLYALPQNRRPQLQEFRLLPPNFGLVPAPALAPSPNMSLSQLIQSSGKDDDKHASSTFLSSQVVPMPGAQIAFWTITDPDGDNLVATFSVRRDGDAAWTDLAVDTAEPYVQFGIAHLPEGVYFTRLVVRETEPRLAAHRLTTDYETDDLVIDHTPPVILDATARRNGDLVTITVHGRDALSLLDGLEATFNNGAHAQTEQPLDGIRDGQEETFVLDVPLPAAAGATSVEVGLYDAAGNTATRRLAL